MYWHNYWIICWILILNVEFTLGLVIKYVGIISIDWVNWLWLLLICAGLWIWLHHLRRQPMLPLPALLHSAEAACLRSGINLPASTRHSERTTFQCKFVKVLVFLKKNYNIIYEVITIELFHLFSGSQTLKPPK